jgi:PhoPQ-activated pathogenicity-related protein
MRKLLTAALAGLMASVVLAGPLDDYIAKKDESYQWRVIDEKVISPHVTYSEVILTSQTWRGMDWHHRMHIYAPKAAKNVRRAFLFIAGGSWLDDKEKQREARLRKERQERDSGKQPAKQPQREPNFEQALATHLATTAGVPAAVLYNVPRQPIFDGKKEDRIISYTFDEYLKTADPTWLLLLPMTKSAVRAMDALQEFAKKEWKIDLDGFVVAGGSKRGWTTWLTAAADKRVKACAPAVIDVLNISAQMKHQLKAWGKYSEQIEDYSRRGLQQKFDTPRGKQLLKIVDPYFYLDRIRQPKMLILGTNDPYWPLDALNLYWDDIVGEKHILYVANKGHAPIDMPRLLATFSSLTLQARGKVSFPKMNWDLKAKADGLTITVTADKRPERVWAFVTESPTRDFRKARWRHEPMKAAEKAYVYELPMPDQGYAAAYAEALFKLEGGQPLYLCTNVRIIGPSQ